MTHTIRTTHRPTVELEVSDAELADLTRRGQVLDTRATTDEGLTRAALRQTGALVEDAPAPAATASPRKAAPRKRASRSRSSATAPAATATAPDAGTSAAPDEAASASSTDTATTEQAAAGGQEE